MRYVTASTPNADTFPYTTIKYLEPVMRFHIEPSYLHQRSVYKAGSYYIGVYIELNLIDSIPFYSPTIKFGRLSRAALKC